MHSTAGTGVRTQWRLLLMDISAHLTYLERSLHDPAIRADPEAVSALLCDDFREFGASGRVWTKAETVAELAVEAPGLITSEEYACQQLSPTLALLTYVAISGQRRTLRSSLWRREGDLWRVLFHQGTVIPPTPAKA